MTVHEQPPESFRQELATLRHQVAVLTTAVTKYEQAEEDLHDSETRFRTLVEGSLQGILVHRQHKPLFANQAFATMLGYTAPTDILQIATVLSLVDPQDRARLNAYCAARLRGEAVPEQYEYQALHRDGTRCWVEVRVSMVQWDGAPAMLLTTVEISARKQAEAALARYHLLASQTQDIMLFIRRDGRIVDANAAAIAAYGYDHATLLTLNIADLRASITLPLLTAQMLEADQLGARFETAHRRKDGSTFPVEVSSIGAEMSGERLLLSIIRDITERKRTASELELLRDQLAAELAGMQRLHETSSMLIYQGDLTALLEEILAAALSVSGTDKGHLQLLNSHSSVLRIVAQRGFTEAFLDFFHTLDLAQVACGAALQDGIRVVIEDVTHSAILRATPELDVMLTAGVRAMQVTPLISRTGQLLGMLSTHYTTPHHPTERTLRLLDLLARQATDAIERTQVEAVVRQHELELRALAEAAPGMVWRSAALGGIEYVNARWLTYTGLTWEQTRGMGWVTALHPGDAEAAMARWQHSLSTGTAFESTHRYRRQDSAYRWHLVRAVPVRDEAGQVLQWVGMSIDVHEAQVAQEMLQQARDALEQRVQERTAALHREMLERQRLEREAQRAEHFALLGRLAAGVSHEIRNPLGAIFLHVDLLEEELQETSPVSPEQLAESLHEIKTHLARLDDLVQDYLSLVRVPDIQREVQDLGAAVQSWAAEWEDLTAAHGVTMCLESVADMGMVAFHASTLRRALLNLVQNALDAMSQGGILTIAGHRTPTHLQLQVRDTGCGISTTELSRIFEPLYTTKPGGTGLGLHIVQEIVMAHEGDVTVESIHGHGTTFTLTLPWGLPRVPT
jgi:PAS domain S-box-containing protein